ncbi:helix-turn-helix domain-containing protein [Streptomyces sp. NPDC087212]|uniref:helix-turn-helix domain-containing protein n=1 Tax=Streptomyces sp. NPDC087212 TaxID=3365766 RepID=UPI003802974D
MANIKQLDPKSSPQAAFGYRLRKIREAKGFTQDELAVPMAYSSQHISAVETCRKQPTQRFARNADRALGLTGTTEAFEREFREMQDGILLEGFPEYLEQEGRAAEIRVFEVGIIPVLLQTPDYARVLAESAAKRGAITPEQADERVSYLAKRQAALVRDRPPMVFVTIDESCIRRPVGGAAVMDAQLAHLVEFAELPNTLLQVAPFGIGERRPLNLPVNVLTLLNRSVICYSESQSQGHLDRHIESVMPMLTAYHQLQAESLSQAATVAMIEQVRKGIL